MRLAALLMVQALIASFPSTASSQEPGPFEGMDDYVQEALETWEVPGLAIAVVRDGKLVLARGYGVCTLGDAPAVTPETVFAIASCTKSFVAACIALLVEEGKLQWDDPVAAHLPGFKLADPVLTRQITLRDLLCHRSGLRRCDPLVERGDFGPADILMRLEHLPIDAPLRTRLTYSNHMYVVLTEVIAHVSGQAWERFANERLLESLQMKSTTFDVTEIPPARLARRHWRSDLGIVPRPIDSLGGGLFSSVQDLSRWVRWHLDDGRVASHQLLQPESIREMHAQQFAVPLRSRPTDNDYAARFYGSGLGWFVQEYRGRKMVVHGGSWGAMVAMMPEERVGVVVLSNLDLETLPALLMHDVFDAFLVGPKATWDSKKWSKSWLRIEPPGGANRPRDAARARLEKERKAGTRPTRSLADFAGTYESKLYGPLEVQHVDGQLKMTFGRFTTELTHWQDDEFIARSPTRLTYDWLLMFEVTAHDSIDEVVIRHIGWDAIEGDQQYRRVK